MFFVCAAAVGAVLLGVVDGDNVALWLPGTDDHGVCCCGLFHLREEKGRREARVDSVLLGRKCLHPLCREPAVR